MRHSTLLARSVTLRSLVGTLALLTTSCSTPREVADQQHDAIVESREAIEDLVILRIAGRLDKDRKDIDKAIESGDDAVRKEVEEAFHTARDGRLEMAATNAKQHAMIRDGLDRNTDKDDKRWETVNLDLSKLRGKVEGNDAALHTAEGVVRGMLFQSMGQLNQAIALARDNERKLALSEEAKKLQRERDLADLREANAAQQDAHFAKLEAAFWDFVQKMAATAGVIAAILGALVTIIYLWKKKGKTDG